MKKKALVNTYTQELIKNGYETKIQLGMFKEFKKFILRGNLVDLAIGFTVGAAFTTVAKSLVNDIIMPPLNLLLGNNALDNFFILMKEGSTPAPYSSLENAKEAGAITLNIGAFINSNLSLLLVAIAMFIIIKMISKLESDIVIVGKKKKEVKKSDPTEKKCPFCYTTIDYRATRCPECTSQLESVEKKKDAKKS